MIVFDKKQVELIKPHCNGIAKSLGVSGKYVHYLIEGKRKQNTEVAKDIMNKANSILQILNS